MTGRNLRDTPFPLHAPRWVDQKGTSRCNERGVLVFSPRPSLWAILHNAVELQQHEKKESALLRASFSVSVLALECRTYPFVSDLFFVHGAVSHFYAAYAVRCRAGLVLLDSRDFSSLIEF